MLPNGLSDRDHTGFSFRQSALGVPLGEGKVLLGSTEIPQPGQAQSGLGGYSGIQSNGRLGSASSAPGKFAPFSSPILEGHPYGPTGQPFTRDANGGATPDCQPGQTGYYYGQNRIPGQPKSNPAEGIADIPGSRGVSDAFCFRTARRSRRTPESSRTCHENPPRPQEASELGSWPDPRGRHLGRVVPRLHEEASLVAHVHGPRRVHDLAEHQHQLPGADRRRQRRQGHERRAPHLQRPRLRRRHERRQGQARTASRRPWSTWRSPTAACRSTRTRR